MIPKQVSGRNLSSDFQSQPQLPSSMACSGARPELKSMFPLKSKALGTSMMVQWLTCLPIQGARVRSLVRKLRSYLPCGN